MARLLLLDFASNDRLPAAPAVLLRSGIVQVEPGLRVYQG